MGHQCHPMQNYYTFSVKKISLKKLYEVQFSISITGISPNLQWQLLSTKSDFENCEKLFTPSNQTIHKYKSINLMFFTFPCALFTIVNTVYLALKQLLKILNPRHSFLWFYVPHHFASFPCFCGLTDFPGVFKDSIFLLLVSFVSHFWLLICMFKIFHLFPVWLKRYHIFQIVLSVSVSMFLLDCLYIKFKTCH